jgi:YidC/Oxa1 family membrane protein insertase
MFLQQKLLAPTPQRSQDGKEQENPAAAMTQSMQYTMPLMFGFFSLQFPAGLSIYFILSNIIGIAQGYYMRWTMNREKAANAVAESAAAANGKAPSKAQTALQTGGNQSGNGARSDGRAASSATSTTTSSKSAKAPTTKPSSSKRKRRSAKR